VLGLLAVCLNAFALSGQQAADRDLGSRHEAITIAIGLGQDASLASVARVQAEVEDAGARNVLTRISSFSVRPDVLPRRFDTGLQKVVSYVEVQGIEAEFPGSYRLVSGTWPTKLGQVALSQELADQIDSPSDFTVFSEAANLRVTGIVEPVYGERSWRILGAPGTWASLPGDAIKTGFPSAEGSLTLFWDGDASVASVARAATAAAGGGEAPESALTSHLSRSELEQASGNPLTSRMPLVYTYPSLIIGALVSLLVVILSRGRSIANLRRLHAVGVRTAPVRFAMVVSLSVMAVLASVAGSAVGFLLGYVSRLTWLPVIIEQPLSPISSPMQRTGLIAALTLVVVAAGGWSRYTLASRRSSRLAEWSKRVPWSVVRRMVGAVAILRAVPVVSSATSIDSVGSGAAWMLVGFLLLAPDLLYPIVWTLRTGRAVPLLARRLIENDRGRYAVAIVALAACMGLPTATGTFLATQTRTEAAGTVSQVPPGQIIVDVANSNPATAKKVQGIIAASSEIGQKPTTVDIAYADGKEIRFEHDGRYGAFAIWVVPDAAALSNMLNGSLTDDARTALESGGVVDWSGSREPQRVVTTDSSGRRAFSDALPTADISANSSYRTKSAGVMLASTADALGLPTTTSRYVFTDMDDEAIRTAARDVTRAGYDARFVEYHITPPPTRPSAEWYVASGGLAAAAFVVVWVILSGQARHLRTHAERLMAMGLRTRWSARVLALQAAITIGIGLAVGLAGGAIPISLFALLSIPGVILDIPWGFIAITFAATLGAAVLASIVSLRSLTPRVSE
jgi:hypothetical protein